MIWPGFLTKRPLRHKLEFLIYVYLMRLRLRVHLHVTARGEDSREAIVISIGRERTPQGRLYKYPIHLMAPR